MNSELIIKINDKCPYEQGIFKEPYGIPVHIKEHVVYTRYDVGGVRGGSCWDDSNPQEYYNDEPKNKLKVLDIVLKELYPDIKYLHYKQIEKLWHVHHETEYEYYGNSTDWKCEYIILSELESLIQKMLRENKLKRIVK